LSREADFGQFFHPTFSILELCMRLGPDHGQPQQGLEFGEYLDGLYGYESSGDNKTKVREYFTGSRV
jgi:hypothetical protein